MKIRALLPVLFGLFGLIAAPAFAQTNPAANPPTYPPAYPRPNATRIIDNDRINAWDVYWMKGQPTPLHTHAIDQFSITLRGGLLRVRPAGGTWSDAHMSKVASVNFVPLGTTHMEEGMSDVPQHKIMLEIKPSPLNPEAHGTAPAPGAAKIFENGRLIAWDMTWKPDEKVARPAVHLDTVTVFVDGGTMRSTQNGTAKTSVRKAGEAVYDAGGTPNQVEEAVSGMPRAIIVELK